MDLQGQQLIGFSTSREGTDTFQASNPATGEDVHPLYAEASQDEIDRALELAGAAHQALKRIPRERRANTRTRAVGFTGSLAGGKAFFDLAMARPEPIPVYAEMGSTNPVFLLPGALREKADELAAGLVASVTLGVGQFCTNPGLVVALEDDATERFAERLGALLDAAPEGTMLHAGIRAGYAAGLERLRSTPSVAALTDAAASGGDCQARPAAFRVRSVTRTRRPRCCRRSFATAARRCRVWSTGSGAGLSRQGRAGCACRSSRRPPLREPLPAVSLRLD